MIRCAWFAGKGTNYIMISLEFTKARAQATRNAQINIADQWVWSEKTVAQWTVDVTKFDQLQQDESSKRTQWRNAAETWENDLVQIQQITRDVRRAGGFRFRNDPVKLALFESLRTDGNGRADIYVQALAARDAWDEADETWELSADVTLAHFGSLLASALARQSAHGTALTAWRRAASELANKARVVDADNVAWYAEATRRFPAGTVEGDLIRSTVPTTTRLMQPVGQAVITNLITSNGDIHFDCAAQYATRYTYLHQAPGSPAFVVAVADTPQTSFNLHGQPAGVHRFKAFGSNAAGQGPESAVVQVTVAAIAVA
jgi:hypothetical protein